MMWITPKGLSDVLDLNLVEMSNRLRMPKAARGKRMPGLVFHSERVGNVFDLEAAVGFAVLVIAGGLIRPNHRAQFLALVAGHRERKILRSILAGGGDIYRIVVSLKGEIIRLPFDTSGQPDAFWNGITIDVARIARGLVARIKELSKDPDWALRNLRTLL